MVACGPAPAFAGSLLQSVPTPEPKEAGKPLSRLDAARELRKEEKKAAYEACKGTNKCVTRADQRRNGVTLGSPEL
eukprot:CAMPEP_0172612054 /NCGR_PEP_ID=MMETSP1068-20121228/31674_1 /TAXON_ID=35684 /ORGANISM="Pseudopedinella elastica, Strain CCMP716" /LENGTH=75 /DNA_ID=CAMNT_0013416191 /DNA_START=141 /DNA_END=368 /DNA_ORIENTATION=+